LFKSAKRPASSPPRRYRRRSDGALGPSANLVTASAFCLRRFHRPFAVAVAKRRSAFYTVLTYDGDQR
jgi:hypothetical protein